MTKEAWDTVKEINENPAEIERENTTIQENKTQSTSER